jgi:hypothetical protein
MSVVVEIKQIPDNAARFVNLHKHNLSKLPGTSHVVQVGKGRDGRYITGFDEESISLNNIKDPEKREGEKARRKALREELEGKLNLKLGGMSPFWETYFLDITSIKALEIDVNPLHKLQYEVLVSNLYVAPDETTASSPDYNNCKFYLYRKDVSDSEKVNKQMTIDEAKSEWLKLSKNDVKANMYARYCLGNKFSADYGKDARYSLMSDWLNKPENAASFIDTMKLKVETLQVKILVDYAISKNVIKHREGYYQRGNATYGRTIADTVAFLESTENSNELASLQEQLLREYNFKP